LDIVVAQKENDPDPVIPKKLSKKLHLRTTNDLKKESNELYEVLISNGDLVESFD